MLTTERLRLVPATRDLMAADLEGPAALSAALGADVPAGWPPELYDRDALTFAIRGFDSGSMRNGWGFYYVLTRPPAGAPPMAIGIGGFKGYPDPAGSVEVGYSILGPYRQQGYASEALDAWVRFAFNSPAVRLVIARTLRGLVPSIRVAERAGFVFAAVEPPGDDTPPGVEILRYERRR